MKFPIQRCVNSILTFLLVLSIFSCGLWVNWNILVDSAVCDSESCTQGQHNDAIDVDKGNSKQHVPAREEEKKGSVDDHCTLYLAESSIPNAGLGMFSAVDVEKGHEVGDPEILIPLPDYDYARLDWWLVEEVYWQPVLHDDLRYETTYSSDVFYPGFGAQINCHMGLINVDHEKPKIDAAGLQRSLHPGIGAFSTYHSIPTKATRPIEAGSELFVDYGENWFEERESWLGVVPFEADFKVADRAMRAYSNFTMERKGKENFTNAAEDDIWSVLRNASDSRVRAALPENRRDVEGALEVGSTRFSLPNFIRTPQWLEENGLCIDNMYAAQSTIHGAGRGAFARRLQRKHSIIAPVPVLQIRRKSLNMHETTLERSTGEVKFRDNVAGKQLLMNYSYGHRNSSVLLVPYSPIVNFINHHSTKANARLRWSESDLNKWEWLSLTPSELLEKQFGLMMELVALRDILPGEEVFLDYGSDWEEAWAAHVRDWSPPKDEDDYVSASELRTRCIDLRTVEQQEEIPYPKNVQTACYYKPSNTRNAVVEEGIKTVQTRWTPAQGSTCLRPCKILSKTTMQGKGFFTAEMGNGPNMKEGCEIPKDERHIVSNVPDDKFTFVDRPYTKHQYIKNAFRHEIGLPDDVFPAAWMDLSKD